MTARLPAAPSPVEPVTAYRCYICTRHFLKEKTAQRCYAKCLSELRAQRRHEAKVMVDYLEANKVRILAKTLDDVPQLLTETFAKRGVPFAMDFDPIKAQVGYVSSHASWFEPSNGAFADIPEIKNRGYSGNTALTINGKTDDLWKYFSRLFMHGFRVERRYGGDTTLVSFAFALDEFPQLALAYFYSVFERQGSAREDHKRQRAALDACRLAIRHAGFDPDAVLGNEAKLVPVMSLYNDDDRRRLQLRKPPRSGTIRNRGSRYRRS